MATNYNTVTIKTIRESGAKNLTEYKKMQESKTTTADTTKTTTTKPVSFIQSGMSISEYNAYLKSQGITPTQVTGTTTETTPTKPVAGTNASGINVKLLTAKQTPLQEPSKEDVEKVKAISGGQLTDAQARLKATELVNKGVPIGQYIAGQQPITAPQVINLQKDISAFNQQYSGKTLSAQEYYTAMQKAKELETRQKQIEAQKGTSPFAETKFVIEKPLALPGQKSYIPDSKNITPITYEKPTKQVVSERFLGLPKETIDITETEFKTGIEKFKKETPGSTELIGQRFEERLKDLAEIYDESFKDTKVSIGTKKMGVFGTTFITGAETQQQTQTEFFKSPGVKTIAAGYETISDVLGQVVGLSKSRTERPFLGKTELTKYESEKILNPRQAALEELMAKQKKISEETLSDFYLGKQVAETGMFLYGGSVATLAGVGSAARSEKIEEAIVPLVLGGVGRVAAKPLGGLISGATSKTNKLIAYVESKIIPKTPVPQNVLVPNVLPRITESAAAKGLMFVGGSVEVIGMQLTPLEQKQEYLRQVGLFNVYTPIGYRVTDVGLMLGKRAAIQSLDIGFDVVKKTTGKDIRGFDTTQYSVVAGEDLMKTPRFVGSEKEMLLATQDITRPGAAKFVYEKFGIVPAKKGVGYGFRSVSGKLGDVIEPKVSYYEGTKIDFFAPEVNPIAMRDIGLKSKLFGKLPGVYDEYSLIPAEPSLRLREFPKATGVSLKKGIPFTEKTLKEMYDIYGWKGLDITFSKDVVIGGINVPKGKTVGQIMQEKIVSGGLGRPIKSREFINLTSEEVFEKLFTDMPKSKVVEFGGAVSSPSRSLGATSESEFITAVGGVRAPPTTRVREFFRKLGFADAYVYYDLDVVPVNYELELKKVVPMLTGTNTDLVVGGGLVKDKSRLLLDSKDFTPVMASDIVPKAKGGYSTELEKVFGLKKPLSKSLVKPIVLSTPKTSMVKPVSTSYKGSYNVLSMGLVSTSELKSYDKAYDQVYGSVYPVKYSDDYSPVYVDDYSPKYTTTYVPEYSVDYTSKYEPPYTPTYPPTYTPPYTPKRPTIYKPPYTPPYYAPPRTPPRKPPTPKKDKSWFETEAKKTKKKGFYGLIKRKGKWIKINKEPLTSTAAINRAAKIADKTLSQSIKIIEAGRPAIGKEERLNLGKFRPSKRTFGVLVEKKKFALEPFEVKEIQKFKKQKTFPKQTFKLSL